MLPTLMAAERIALLKDNAILLVGPDGQGASKLGGESPAKSELRWLRDGQRLSYLVPDNSGAKARLVVVHLTGKVLKEVAIRPVTDPPTEGLRFVEELSWVSPVKVWVSGSANPSVCEMFDLDVNTSKESNWQTGECGSFVASPDGKHIAYLEEMNGSDDERADTVGIDDTKVVALDSPGARVLAGPVWFQDSSGVAVFEKQFDSGKLDVTTFSVSDRINSVHIPSSFGDNPTLDTVGAQVVVRSGNRSLLVNTRTRRTSPVPDLIRLRVERADQVRKRAEESKKNLQNVMKRLGAREGVAWPAVTKN